MLGLIFGSLFFGCTITERGCNFKEKYGEAREVGTEVGQLMCEAWKINKQANLGNDIEQFKAGELEKWAAELDKRTKGMSKDAQKEAEKRMRAELHRCKRKEKNKNDK